MDQPGLFDADVTEGVEAADVLVLVAESLAEGTPMFERLQLEALATGEVIGKMYFPANDVFESIYIRVG